MSRDQKTNIIPAVAIRSGESVPDDGPIPPPRNRSSRNSQFAPTRVVKNVSLLAPTGVLANASTKVSTVSVIS